MKKRFLLMLLAAGTAMAGDGGFLFVTFKGEQSPMTEQIYFALSKDGRKWDEKDEKFKAITMECSNTLTGTWAEVPGFSLAQLRGYEGPECYQVEAATDGKPATWCLILDQYSKSAGYQPFISNDLAGGQFTPGEGFSFPFHFRHGSILPLTKQEYSRLEAAFNKPKR